MGGFITKNCPLAIYFQFRFYKSCACHVFYVWKRMTWIDKWPYFSRSFTREPQFLKEKWSPPSSRPGERKMLFFFFFGKKRRTIIQRGDGASAPLALGGGPTSLTSPNHRGKGPASLQWFCAWISTLSLLHLGRDGGGRYWPGRKVQLWGTALTLCTTLLWVSQSWKLEFSPF